MIDFHSHILPCIDDGSKNVEETLEMLSLLKKQGVTRVVATPHFCANFNSIDDFLSKRDKSYQMISKYTTIDFPEILLGAEVKYYEGISRLENLEKLCISDSKLLLLEMPMRKWTEYITREIKEIALSGKVIVVLAHVERYLRFNNKITFEELLSYGVLFQSNADFFLKLSTKLKAVSMINKGWIHFIGSDCHNLNDRSPRIGHAISYIERKTGSNSIDRLNNLAESFL